MSEEKKPFYAHCKDCGHEWVVFYTPLTMDKAGMKLLKCAGKSPCPKCTGKKVYAGKKP